MSAVRLRRQLLAYLVAIGLSVAGLALRLAMDPYIGERAPFITFYLVLVAAALIGGWRAGLLALVVTAAGSSYYLLPPRSSFEIAHRADLLTLVAFILVGGVLIFIVRALHRSKRAAREYGELLCVTLTSIGDGVISTDDTGRVTMLNGVAEELTGWKSADAKGREIHEVFSITNEDTGKPLDNPVLVALKSGGTTRIGKPAVLVGKDGRRHVVEDSAAPIHERSGQTKGAVLVFRDVTEQRSLQRKRDQALATLNNLVACVPVGIAILDRDLRYLQVNRQLADMNGLPREEHVGKKIRDIVPALADHAEEVGRRVLETQETVTDEVLEGEVLAKPGVQGAWREGWFPMMSEDGKTDGVGVIVQDITEERRATRELAEVSQRFLSLLHNTPLAVVEWDAEFVVRRWSGCSEKTFGWNDNEVIGRHLWNLPMVYEGDREKVQSTMYKLLQPRTRFVVSHNRNLTKTGQVIDCEWYNSTVHGEDGRLVAVLSLVLDVTERNRALNLLREADRRKDEFLATLAHELRNPLAPIKSLLDLLKDSEHDAEAVKRGHEMIERQVGHMVRLIDDLMDVSRITRNKLTLRREKLDVREILNRAMEISRPLCERRGQKLSLVLSSEDLVVEGDLARLTQVFGNLLHNACKFTQDGGDITISAHGEGSDVVIVIQDNGRGIPSALLPKVFDLFVQLNPTTDVVETGLGIGLALVKRLVEMHGGTVTASSGGMGHGSAFTVRLPLADATTAPEPAREIQMPAALPHGLRVLIVDDNTDAAASFERLMQRAGNETAVAHDGEEAVEKAAAFAPHIVLLDVGLPKLSGLDVCRAIRLQPGGKERIVVAMTGWGQEQDRRESAQAGFDDHLVKPVSLNELKASLHRLRQERMSDGSWSEPPAS